MVATAGSLWVTDGPSKQLWNIDTTTGSALHTWGPGDGLNWEADDVTKTDDGTLFFTVPARGKVGAVTPAGQVVEVSTVLDEPNPIELLPDGRIVVADFSLDGEMWVFDPDDLQPGTPLVGVRVGEHLPGLNGMDIGPDGMLYTPIGGKETQGTSTGGLARVDPGTFQLEEIALTFPDEPNRTGFRVAAGVGVLADGTVLLVEGFGARVFRIDPATGEAHLLVKLPTDFGDNVEVDPNGRIFVSSFLSSTIFEVFMDGTFTRMVP